MKEVVEIHSHVKWEPDIKWSIRQFKMPGGKQTSGLYLDKWDKWCGTFLCVFANVSSPILD